MTSLSDLQAARVSAGDAYVSAVTALKTAFIELAAIERTLQSTSGQFAHAGAPTAHFGEYPDVVKLRHPVFAPNLAGDWSEQVAARAAEIAANGGVA